MNSRGGSVTDFRSRVASATASLARTARMEPPSGLPNHCARCGHPRWRPRLPVPRRPGGARVLAALASGAATCVIACKLDRLFRNTADALTLTESWNRGGVALHLLDLNVDTSTTMGRFFLSIIAAAAELERSMGADRTRAALEQVKAQGGRLGRDAHGWRRLDAVDDCGRRVVESVPGELAAVARAVELRRSGATLAAVSAVLNREGLPTKRGAVWRAGTVRAVLGRVG